MEQKAFFVNKVGPVSNSKFVQPRIEIFFLVM